MLLQTKMSTLHSSPVIVPFWMSSGIAESGKSIVSNHHAYDNKITHLSENTDTERKLVTGKIMQSFTRPPYCNLNKPDVTSRVSVNRVQQRCTFSTETKKASAYRFRTEFGDPVNVYVRKTSVNYSVYIDVSSLQHGSSVDGLILCWGVYRSDPLLPVARNFDSPAPDERTGPTETPFLKTSTGQLALELEFEAKQIPFYLSFILKYPAYADSGDSEIRSHRKTNFSVPIGFGHGHPFPLGLSFSTDGSMNFSIFSRTAESMVLCLYDDSNMENPALELDLDPCINRSGDIWHASFESSWNFVSYGYRSKASLLDHILLDPYAKIISNSITSNPRNGSTKYLGRLSKEPDFNWDGDVHPSIPMENLVVYRLNVKHFTEHKSSKLPADVGGTYSGLKQKLQHFKDLGMNTVLLEPIFPFDEQKGPYYPFHFFSPLNSYGPSGGPVSAITSMKEMVKELHANGIEVLMEVVFTHTTNIGALQGIDNSSYYLEKEIKDLEAKHALNCNYPIVQQLILDSLHHWVTEFHIDGFCFINSSSLLRGFHGEYLSRPPLLEAITFDPLLSKTKVISDCWDPHDLISEEIRFPHWKRWAEVNTKFCSDVRNFLRGKGLLSDLATRLCGSGDIFSDGRGPAFSFNFIARNCGLPLVDLVSFSIDDELASELSWNCGEEGPTNKTAVLQRRLKQIRNFLFILYVSLGVPVLNMGDECGRSSGGSLAYNDRKPLDWNALETGFGIQTTQFILFLSSFRKKNNLFQKRNFLKEENIDWHGSDQSPPRWKDPSCKFLAMTLKPDKEENASSSKNSDMEGTIYMAFNASDHSESVILPAASEGMAWYRLVDTALPFPGFFSIEGEAVPEQMVGLVAYEMKSHSCTLFEVKSF